MRFRIASRGAAKRLAVLAVLLVVAIIWGWFAMIRMPGESFRGPLPALTEEQRQLAAALRADVEALATEIGPRSTVRPAALAASADYLEQRLRDAGYEPRRQVYRADGVDCFNVEAELTGGAAADEIIVVGAHYDSVIVDHVTCPGANDNASGCAATLALAADLAGSRPRRTLRFVLFTNEEPPHFQQPTMGSLVYAQRCRERGETIVAMISMETIGCYLDEPGSQKYPPLFSLAYPSTGDFIAFVGNVSSRHLVREMVGSFRQRARFPSQGGALPGFITGVGWSDHWAFWKHGYPAVMVTDTAPFRYVHYHRATDTPEKLDYERMARVVEGVREVVRAMAGGSADAAP